MQFQRKTRELIETIERRTGSKMVSAERRGSQHYQVILEKNGTRVLTTVSSTTSDRKAALNASCIVRRQFALAGAL